MDLFLNGQCIACHAIQGLQDQNGNPLQANGGPNLTHFASRECFAGCWLQNRGRREQLSAWLDNPAAVKARLVDARLQPHAGRDRCPRRLPAEPDVTEGPWRA